MSLRVLFVSRRFPPEVVGGGEVSALLLARALRARGLDVHVCTFTRHAAEAGDGQVEGVPVVRQHLRVPVPPAGWGPVAARLADREPVYLEMARAAGAVAARLRPDRLHALNLESIPAVAWLALRRHRPFVATINSPWMLCYTGDGVDAAGDTCIDCRPIKRLDCIAHRSGRRAQGGLERAARSTSLIDGLEWLHSHLWYHLFRQTALRAAALLPISAGLHADLARLGYPGDRLVTVRNPIELLPLADGAAVRHRLGIPEGTFVAGYLGRRSPAKGLGLLVEAVARHPGMHLLVVGRDEGCGDALEQQARALGLLGRLHLVDHLPPEELAPYYAACQVVVMAGPFYEALGRMSMEAAAQQVPAVARAHGGIPDVVVDGVTGLLLRATAPDAVVRELAGILGRLASDRALAARLGVAARRRMASLFASERSAAQLEAVYRGDLDQARRLGEPVNDTPGAGSPGQEPWPLRSLV